MIRSSSTIAVMDSDAARDVAGLLDRARGGDRVALDSLLVAVQNQLSQMVSRHLGDDLRARLNVSDLLQSSYLDVVRAIDSFRGQDEASFVAWVGSIVRNNINDKSKYFGAEKRGGIVHGDLMLDEVRGVQAKGPSPSSRVVRVENLVLVSQALESLTDVQRKVIFLRMVEARSHAEIGSLIGRTEAATRMLLSRARLALAVEMERLAGEE